ncbi:hypothetical protein QR98_0096940 [Sarcoptes scabiei]|uniref:Uncharacterized protein n=1 Tax=Sarcoptes scabiei TaxID=52283 RepID=A0A132AJN4_SARSC|nr:hypothetical protein QR98_0096940 [Sarcoptes scabiei]
MNADSKIETNAEPEIGSNAEPEIKMEAEPEIETNAEPGIKMNAEPEIRTNAELEIGTNAEPEIGTNAEHADINAINEAKQIVNGVMQSNNDPSNDGNRPLNTSTFEDEELLVLFMNCLKDEMRVDLEMQGLIRLAKFIQKIH